MTTFDKLWVVIPFYRGESTIEALLNNLGDSWTQKLNVVIVDNSPWRSEVSADQYWSSIIARYQRLHVIRSQSGLGFGRACNLGATYAFKQGASHAMILNQDATIDSDSMGILWETSKNLSSSVVAPVEVIPHSTSIHPQYAEWYLDRITPSSLPLDVAELPDRPICRKTLCGMCMVIPRNVAETVGMFDPLFTMYGEDGDFCRRLRQNGIEMYLEPRAIVEHEHSNLSAQGDDRSRITTWIREARVIQRLKGVNGYILQDIAYILGRRVVERVYDAVVIRSFERVRLGFESDKRLWFKRDMLRRARMGQSVVDRARLITRKDMKEAVVFNSKNPI